ncbi:TlpA family protein disulfide reductase [Robertkochia solimangrovi]|uniref:TlpA family protein disulfide reductase n=1 Tax=Robertkochia solimangrovi TaxID=2213046 RepID=UPI00117CA65B|nr:TlpA disulfide reductase family protein [Robertkochia solimangrovi]TRZ41301.1 hypothetical protein DMZ48_17890 [Robertkochia solimangrovi]
MKRYYTGLLLSIQCCLISCKQELPMSGTHHKFHVSGELESSYSGEFYARIKDTSFEQGFRMDTLRVTEGKFEYTGEVMSLEKRTFYSRDSILRKIIPGGYIPSKANELVFYVFPGADLSVSGRLDTFVNAYPNGDPANASIAALNRSIYPMIDARAESIQNSILTKDSILKTALKVKSDSLYDMILSTKRQFIDKNPGTIAAIDIFLDMLSRKELTENEALQIFESFEGDAIGNSIYMEAESRIKGIRFTSVGEEVPEIKTYATLDGTIFDLQSLRGYFVILDFWGTWCAPCVSEMPELSKFYHKHQKDLRIVAINSGDTPERIRSFLKSKPEYDWFQLLSAKGEDPDNFVSAFNVTAFPTKIIVSPDGKILAKYVGYDEGLYVILEDLFKEER